MTFSYIAQTTFKRAHKSIYETLKIVFKFTAKQVCQKPLFTETCALCSRSCADLLQAALFDGSMCVPQPYSDAREAALPVMYVPNISQFLKMKRIHKEPEQNSQVACTSRVPISVIPTALASHQLPWVLGLFWPSNLWCILALCVPPEAFFARSLGNSAEKPADISGVLSRTSISPLREI